MCHQSVGIDENVFDKVYVEQERFSNSRPVGGAAKRGTDKRREVEGAKKTAAI